MRPLFLRFVGQFAAAAARFSDDGRLRSASQVLANFEVASIAALVCASLFSVRLLPVAFAVAVVFWPIRWLAVGRLSVRTSADIPLALLLLMMPVTLWATALPVVTAVQVWGLLAGLALYYALANWAHSPPRILALAGGITLAGVALAIAAPFTVRWFGSAKPFLVPAVVYGRLPLLAADPAHPNVVAGALALLLPIPAALLLFRWRALRWTCRILIALSVVLMLVVVILTKSRGGLLAAGAALLLLAVLHSRRGWLVLLAAIMAGCFLVWGLGLSRSADILAGGGTISGLNGRLEIWSRAIYMLEDFPFTGIGMGTFKQVANSLYPFFLAGPDADVPHAHNLLLQVGVDLGVPGLVAYLALLLATAWSLLVELRRPGSFRWLAAGLLASLLALSVHGLFDAATWGTRPAILPWAVFGLAAAMTNASVREQRRDLGYEL